MAKKVDITEKLSFDENPCLLVKSIELEVNADASTALKLLGLIGNGVESPEQVTNMYELLFTEEAKEKIESLHLSFQDFKVVVENAIQLITGEEEPGEEKTHTTI